MESISCELSHINASKNFITKIDDLSVAVPNLKSLVVVRNKLSNADSIRNVIYLRDLKELNLSNNEINCSLESILKILAQCKSLKILSLKGNPVTKTKHFRKLVISRCPKLIRLDGRPICREERRRCNAWGQAVLDGKSYDEADRADNLELNRLRSERSEANALRRSLLSFFSNKSEEAEQDRALLCCALPASRDDKSKITEGIKRTFGLIDRRRRASSTISWSSRRNLHQSQVDTDELLKTELEHVKHIIKLQRKEIISLKESLAAAEKKAGKKTIRGMSSIDDSERDTSYSFENPIPATAAHQAGLREIQQAFADMTWEDCMSQANNNDKKSSSFLVFPPVPPPPQHNARRQKSKENSNLIPLATDNLLGI